MWWVMQVQQLWKEKKKKSSYRRDVEQNGPALTFTGGEKVIGELVYCWGERKCHRQHTSAAWQRATCPRPTPRAPWDFMMGVGLRGADLPGVPCWFSRLTLNRIGRGTYGSVIPSLLVPSLPTGLSNTAKKMSRVPKNRAPQPERVKCKLNSSLWSLSKKSWKLRRHQGLWIFKGPKSLSTF